MLDRCLTELGPCVDALLIGSSLGCEPEKTLVTQNTFKNQLYQHFQASSLVTMRVYPSRFKLGRTGKVLGESEARDRAGIHCQRRLRVC